MFKITKKKLGVGASVIVAAVLLSGCMGSYGTKVNNRFHSHYIDNDYEYNEDNSITLHRSKVVKVFSTNYNDAPSDRKASAQMSHNINEYLGQITNLSDYNISVSNSQVSDDSDDHGDETQTVVVTLYRNRK